MSVVSQQSASSQSLVICSSANHQLIMSSSPTHHPLNIWSSSTHYPFKYDQLLTLSTYRFPHGSKTASSFSVLFVEVLLPLNSASIELVSFLLKSLSTNLRVFPWGKIWFANFTLGKLIDILQLCLPHSKYTL